MMQSNLRKYSSAAIVFAASAVFLFLFMSRSLALYDEGFMLLDARRVLAGDLIHRDFYSVYGPAYYYILALILSLSDYQFIVARLFSVAVMAAIVTSTYALLAPRTSVLVAAVFAGICSAFLVLSEYYHYPIFPCILIALAGSGLLLSQDGLFSWPRLALAGALTGLAALFRYDAGFFLALVHGLGILLLMPRTGAAWRHGCLRAIAVYAAGTAAIFLPAALPFIAAGGAAGFYNDIIDYALHHYTGMRGLPFPTPFDAIKKPVTLVIYYPLVVTALALADIRIQTHFQKIRTRIALAQSPVIAFQVLFVLLTLVFYYKGIVRVSPAHLMMSIVPAHILLAVTLHRWIVLPGLPRLIGWIGLAGAAVFSLGASAGTLHYRLKFPADSPIGLIVRPEAWSTSEDARIARCNPLPAIRFARLPPDLTRIAIFLQRHSGPNERVFVGLKRHDIVFTNVPALYFAADRPPASRWAQFDPGMTNRADVQTEIIGELDRAATRWVCARRHRLSQGAQWQLGQQWRPSPRRLSRRELSAIGPLGRFRDLAAQRRRCPRTRPGRQLHAEAPIGRPQPAADVCFSEGAVKTSQPEIFRSMKP